METIEVGIDLGTTNSAVAIIHKNEVEIIKNSNGDETTPSIVFANKSGNLIVGSKAKKHTQSNSNVNSAQNWKAEVKRLMGTNEIIKLANYDKEMTAEDISAEILKSLISDVKRRYTDIGTSSAVITVPSHFSTLQSEATKRAGELAGISNVVLLQEPIATAVAYGLTKNINENWIVYDLGGGTFDVSLVASRDGSLNILANGGDNYLGGKDIDIAIVDNFIIPFLKRAGYKLNYTSDLYKKLKVFAEQGKIDLSSVEATTIDIELNINGDTISESIPFSRTDLLVSCKPVLDKSLEICKETIKESHVNIESIKKIVLVGGPTQMPVLRQYLKDNLEIQVDGSQDPLTVVARGAVLFGQQIPISKKPEKKDKSSETTPSYELKINFNPVTSEEKQTVTGKLVAGNNNILAKTICFQAEDKSYDSGDVILKNNTFILQIPTGSKSTQYWIYLKDQTGNLISCNPDRIAVSKGVSISGVPLPHSVGVSIRSMIPSKDHEIDEIMEFFFSRNSILPVTETKKFKTFSDLKMSEIKNVLPIRVYEGESIIPNRNSLICDLAITGKMAPKGLKKNSPVEISLSIDESRQLTVKAYLPEIDLSLDARATIYDENIPVDSLKKTLKEQSERNSNIEAIDDSKEKINELISDIEKTLNKSDSDSDQKRKASKQIKDLMRTIDKTEAKATFDKNTADFFQLSEEIESYLSESNPKEKRKEYIAVFNTIKQEGLKFIESKDALNLKQIIKKMESHEWKCMCYDPVILKSWVQQAKLEKNTFEDKETLEKLIDQCETAIDNNDIENLQDGVLNIWALTNKNSSSSIKTIKAGITR